MSRRTSVETGTQGTGATNGDEQTPLLESASPSHQRDHFPESPGTSVLGTLISCVGGVYWGLLDCCGVGDAIRRRMDKWREQDELNIYSVPSLAILMSYFSVGIALELLATPIAYYLIDDLGAESGVYTVWVILTTLPWSFKASGDCVYVCVGRGSGGGGVPSRVTVDPLLHRHPLLHRPTPTSSACAMSNQCIPLVT